MIVEKLDHYGRGIIKVDKKVGFIKNALPEENIEYRITKNKKNYFYGDVTKYNTFSKGRTTPKCKYSNLCGGCQIDHMNYKSQLDYKCKKTEEILKRFGGISMKLNINYNTNTYHYRNKIVLHVIDGKLGLLREESNEIVEIDECLLVDDKINEVINKLKRINLGKVNRVTIKTGNKTNELMLIIDKKINNYEELIKLVDVLVIDDKIITKKEYITSIIGDKKYKVSSNSFFQVNEYLTKDLYTYIKDKIKGIKAKNVLDLYCGTGTIGIFISDIVDKVLGIEIVESAIEDAEFNKELNNCNNISFIKGKVEDIVEDIKDSFDTIIIDPPRAGLHKDVVNYIVNNKFKNIIYVSCDAVTMARDLERICSVYKISSIELFDMFPNTYHVESISVLERKNVEK